LCNITTYLPDYTANFPEDSKFTNVRKESLTNVAFRKLPLSLISLKLRIKSHLISVSLLFLPFFCVVLKFNLNLPRLASFRRVRYEEGIGEWTDAYINFELLHAR